MMRAASATEAALMQDLLERISDIGFSGTFDCAQRIKQHGCHFISVSDVVTYTCNG